MYKSKRKQNFLFNQTTLAIVETRGDGDVTEAGWRNRQINNKPTNEQTNKQKKQTNKQTNKQTKNER